MVLRIYSIGIAFLLDMLLGDPYHFPHPVRFIGKFISFMDVNLRRIFQGKNGLYLAGFFLNISTLALTFIISFFVIFLAGKINDVFKVIVEGFMLYTCFSVKCLKDEALKIYKTLVHEDLSASRKALSYIVGRDTDHLSKSQIIRAVVETVAENTVDGFLSPLFYALIGGAPLAMTYKAVNTLDSMVGYKNEKYRYMGFFSAKVDDVLNFIPARLSIIFFGLSAFLLRYDWKNSFKIAIRDRQNHKSPNCAYPEGSVAGALDIQLGGTNRYFGEEVYKPTIGDCLRAIDSEDIVKTCQLMVTAALLATITGLWVYYLFLCIRR